MKKLLIIILLTVAMSSCRENLERNGKTYVPSPDSEVQVVDIHGDTVVLIISGDYKGVYRNLDSPQLK